MGYQTDARAALNMWWSTFAAGFAANPDTTFGMLNQVPSQFGNYLVLAGITVEDDGEATIGGAVRRWVTTVEIVVAVAANLGLERARKINDQIRKDLLDVTLYGRQMVVNYTMQEQPVQLNGPGEGIGFVYSWPFISE